jgi:hypothetical protein
MLTSHATSAFTQRMMAKMGFESMAEVKYSDYS